MHKYFKKALVTLTTLALFITGTAQAGAGYKYNNYNNDVKITSSSSDTYDHHVNINYCISESAMVTLAIYEDEGRRTSTSLISTVIDDQFRSKGCYTEEWNVYVDKTDKLYYALTINGSDYTKSYGTDYQAGWIDNSPVKVKSTTKTSKTNYNNNNYNYNNYNYNNYNYNYNYNTYYNNDRYNNDRYNNDCSSFYDVDNNDFYCEAITWASDNNIFTGYSDNSFRPNQSINRAEALKVILEAFNADIYGRHGNYSSFKDVQQYSWYNAYVETANYYGIARGYSDRTFRPAQTVSRVEALKMLLDTAQEFDGLRLSNNRYSRSRTYRDTPDTYDTAWYQSYVQYSYENNLTGDSTNFYPDYTMTRAELAYMLYQYFETK